MEKSLFRYIWTHSKKEQIVLLLVTVATFPILYVSLELPKRIINDAIGDAQEAVTVLGVTLTQIEFLLVLCVGFLLAVLANGLLKMRLNTMKGVLAERLLRRFRYQLLTRITRFPRPYFRQTSQGELVSMVTSEAEPMGGLMGDMLAQPVFQAGQMLTILTFLFAQSVWFGLASIALIPLQAWLIPKLQRQINLLNKARIKEVRNFSTDIGETAAAVSDIRTNGGLRYRMAQFSDRLGRLFEIRFEIYQKKFFMKFLNNFINQLTPFFFYSVGGYLAITGEITVGALVAALAAYKDLSSPWRELLSFYNRAQDMALRWTVVLERFAPDTLVDDSLFDGEPDEVVSLRGDIRIDAVTVRDEHGQPVLEDITLDIPQGARVAVKTGSEITARAFADLLTREVVPQAGSVTIAGHNLNTLHQSNIAQRVGYAHSSPELLQGTLGANLLLPFKRKPVARDAESTDVDRFQGEARRAGNSTDPLDAQWVDPSVAGLASVDEIKAWWFQLVQAMGIDEFMVRRALRSWLNPATHGRLIEEIIRLRPEIRQRLADAGVSDIVHEFHPDKFNPVTPLGSNLLYALPDHPLTQRELAEDKNFVRMLREEGVTDELAKLAAQLLEGLMTTFGKDGTDHPMFQRLNMDLELYSELGAIVMDYKQGGEASLSVEQYALMLTVPFAFSADQIGPAVDEAFIERLLDIRKRNAAHMVAALNGQFETFNPERYLPVMTLLGNAIFGTVSQMAGAREKIVEDTVVAVLNENGLRRLAAQSIFDVETATGGDNLPAVFRERVAFSRAGIKKPDVLILGNALASHDATARAEMRSRISDLMPETTKIFIEKQINNPENYDVYVEIVDGRIDGLVQAEAPASQSAQADLNRKLKVIAQTDLFQGLERKHQRLLAFSARWYKAESGQVIFATDEEPDAAYLCVDGRAGMYWPVEDGDEDYLVTEVTSGRLVGDLSVILGKRRTLYLKAMEDCVFLRLSAQDLLSVIESDVRVATSLLRSVGDHLIGAGDTIRSMQDYAIARGVDFSEYDP